MKTPTKNQKSHGKIPLVELLATPFFIRFGGENISPTIKCNSSVWLSLNVVSFFAIFSIFHLISILFAYSPFLLGAPSSPFVSPSRCELLTSTPTVSLNLLLSTPLLLFTLRGKRLLLESLASPSSQSACLPLSSTHSPLFTPYLAQCMNSVFSLIFAKCNFPFVHLANKMQSLLNVVDW